MQDILQFSAISKSIQTEGKKPAANLPSPQLYNQEGQSKSERERKREITRPMQ